MDKTASAKSLTALCSKPYLNNHKDTIMHSLNRLTTHSSIYKLYINFVYLHIIPVLSDSALPMCALEHLSENRIENKEFRMQRSKRTRTFKPHPALVKFLSSSENMKPNSEEQAHLKLTFHPLQLTIKNKHTSPNYNQQSRTSTFQTYISPNYN